MVNIEKVVIKSLFRNGTVLEMLWNAVSGDWGSSSLIFLNSAILTRRPISIDFWFINYKWLKFDHSKNKARFKVLTRPYGEPVRRLPRNPQEPCNEPQIWWAPSQLLRRQSPSRLPPAPDTYTQGRQKTQQMEKCYSYLLNFRPKCRKIDTVIITNHICWFVTIHKIFKWQRPRWPCTGAMKLIGIMMVFNMAAITSVANDLHMA